MKTLLLFLAATALTGCGGTGQEDGTRLAPAELRRALGAEPATLDPPSAIDNFSAQVIYDLYEGLTAISPEGQVVPGVAAEWAIDATATEYKFTLRSDAKWSNGNAVRAQDFVSSWHRAIDRRFSLPISNDIKTLAGANEIVAGREPVESLGVVAESDTVLRVKLDKPVAYFLELLAHNTMLPVFSDESARSHQGGQLISNGPYKLAAWQPGGSVKLDANTHYWNRANVKVDHVTYLIITNQDAQYAAYRSGQVDITDTAPPAALKEYGADKSRELFVSPYLATAYYGLNFLSEKLAKNLSLRTALVMAVDRNRLVASLGLGQVAAYGLIPPGTWNYATQNYKWSSLNNNEREKNARDFYEKAGYSRQNPLKLRLLVNSSQSIKQTALVVAAMWKETLGVETLITDEEFRVFLQSRKNPKSWDVLRLAWNADFNDASSFLEVFTTNAQNNDISYRSQLFNASVQRAALSTDLSERRILLENSEKILLADYPIVPLYHFVSKHLVKPYVLGFRSNPYDRIASKSLTVQSTAK